jgi:hypothetical protein
MKVVSNLVVSAIVDHMFLLQALVVLVTFSDGNIYIVEVLLMNCMQSSTFCNRADKCGV